jgi:hypothetical protein
LDVGFAYKVVRIGRRPGNQRQAVNKLFIDHFSERNFRRLGGLVEGWKDNDILKPRLKILRDCVSPLKRSAPRSNPSNVILPALIAQIDGITVDFMKSKGFSLRRGKWKDANGNPIDRNTWFNGQVPSNRMEALAARLLVTILFQNAWHGVPLKIPSTFSRHKIMHGESMKYGRMENTIRAFLIIDFLASLE